VKEQEGNKIDPTFSQLGCHLRADWRHVGRLPDGISRSNKDPANRRDSECDRLDIDRHGAEYTDVVSRSFALRDGDRYGDLAGNRVHHRGCQAGVARLPDLDRTDPSVVRNGTVLRERFLPALATGCLAQYHLRDRARYPGAIFGAGIARLARLEEPHRRGQESPGTVNRI